MAPTVFPKHAMGSSSFVVISCVTVVGCIVGGPTGGIAAASSASLVAMCLCALGIFQFFDMCRKDPGWLDRPSNTASFGKNLANGTNK